MDHILIVEDDRALSQGIRLALDQAGRQFTQCHTCLLYTSDAADD